MCASNHHVEVRRIGAMPSHILQHVAHIGWYYARSVPAVLAERHRYHPTERRDGMVGLTATN
jgi:hypothetical protein